MTARLVSPVGAFVQGWLALCRAPLLLAMVVVVTVLLAAPLAVILGSRVQASLSTQPPVSLDETEIDAEWWQEFQDHARGLDATFTPAVLGFAAPLDGFSAVLDGRRPPLALVGPIGLSIAVWAFLWGGLLTRFAAGRAIGMRAFVAAGARHAAPLIVIAAAAAAALILLYLTVHQALFGPVFAWLAPVSTTEVARFLIRVVLYLVFLVPMALIGLVADYARIAAVSGVAATVGGALRSGAGFVRSHLRATALLCLLSAVVFAVVTIGYGALEIYGGSQVGGWRAIAIGQTYIVVRLAIRLATAAAELQLFGSGAMR
jgi:hypothetical protein